MGCNASYSEVKIIILDSFGQFWSNFFEKNLKF